MTPKQVNLCEMDGEQFELMCPVMVESVVLEAHGEECEPVSYTRTDILHRIRERIEDEWGWSTEGRNCLRIIGEELSQ